MANYAARTQDGYLTKAGTSYANAQSATPTVDTSSTTARAGQYSSASYYVCRSYLSFDTTAIPTGSTILTASLTFTCTSAATPRHWALTAHYRTQPTWGGTLAAGDWGSGSVSAGTLVTDTNTIIANQVLTVNMAIASINAGGYTEYEVKCDSEGSSYGDYVDIATADNATYKPYLTVTYTPPPDEIGDNMDQDGACVVLIIV